MSTAPTNHRNYHIHHPAQDQEARPQESSPLVDSQAGGGVPPAPADAASVSPVKPWLVGYLPLKRFFDCTLAVALLIVSAPMILAGVLVVKLTSRGPALYRQVRL